MVLHEPTGEVRRLSDFHGRYLLVNFWATWCFACIPEMSAFQKLQEHFGDRLQVIGIATSDTKVRVSAFAQTKGIRYPLLLDSSGEAVNLFQVDGTLPVTFLLDPEGKRILLPLPETGELVSRVEGAHGWDSIRVIRALEKILSKPRSD